MSRGRCINYLLLIWLLTGFYFTATLLFILWSPINDNTGPDISAMDNSYKDKFENFRPSIQKSKRFLKASNYTFLAPLKIIDHLEFQETETTTAEEADQWTRVNNPESVSKLLVYSAYLDRRDPKYCVRIIGVTTTKNSPPVKCKLHFESGKISESITIAKKPMNEHWNLNYSAHFFSCCPNSKESFTENPVSVLVFEDGQESFGKAIKVRDNYRDRQSSKGQIALCVKPLHYGYNRATWLIEFLEFYTIMGVQKFLFYNHSLGSDVETVLSFYAKKKQLTLLPWQLDVVSQKEIRTEGLFAALNDCVYRFMHLYKYVVIVDLDEFIVPKVHRTYTELINTLETKRDTCSSGFIFQNAFFYLYWENDTSLFGNKPEVPPRNLPYLLTQYKTKRSTEFYPYGKRSKFIVIPEQAVEIGNHMIWRSRPKCKPVKVPEKLATVHHFRICEFGGFKCISKPARIDQTAHKFGIELMTRVIRKCYQMFTNCNTTCPLSEPLGAPY